MERAAADPPTGIHGERIPLLRADLYGAGCGGDAGSGTGAGGWWLWHQRGRRRRMGHQYGWQQRSEGEIRAKYPAFPSRLILLIEFCFSGEIRGEMKTDVLVSTLAAYLNALTGEGVHGTI